jgi:hypothetical protein
MEWGSTVGYFALLESKSEQQLYEICARSRPAVKPPELSHEASQSGPINASTTLPWTMRLIAATARFESQSTASQKNDTLTGNFLLASATAREIAPADARPSAQELEVGSKTAKFSTAQTAIDC